MTPGVAWLWAIALGLAFWVGVGILAKLLWTVLL